MPEEEKAPEQHQTQPEPQKETPKAEVAEKPKDPNRQEQSRLHKRVAEAEKGKREAEKALADVRKQHAEAQASLKYLRDSGESDDTLEERATRLAKMETEFKAAAEERELRIAEYEKRLTIRTLVEQYGIPAEDLEGYDNTREMELVAREWVVENKLNGAKAQGQPDDEEKSEPEPQRRKFDTGMPDVAPKPIADMTPTEFAAYRQQIKDRALKR